MAPPERGELLPTETRSDYSPEDIELVKQTRVEVDRYRSMDRLIPSPHNIVTIAALEVSLITPSDPAHCLYFLVVLYGFRRSQPCPQPPEGILPLHTVRNSYNVLSVDSDEYAGREITLKSALQHLMACSSPNGIHPK